MTGVATMAIFRGARPRWSRRAGRPIAERVRRAAGDALGLPGGSLCRYEAGREPRPSAPRSDSRASATKAVKGVCAILRALHAETLRGRRGRGPVGYANLDQGPAGDPGRGGRTRNRRRGRPHRRIGRARRRAANAGRRRLRRLSPCRAARTGQRPSSFLPDADARPPGGDQPRIVRLADRALSDLGAAQAARPAPGDAAGAGRAAALRLHHRRRPSLPLSRRPGERGRHRSRGSARARHADDGDARLDEPLAEGRRPAARLGGAGRRYDPRRQRARAEAVPRSQGPAR